MTAISDRKTLDWPDLPFEEWKPTCETLHMWAQIVGKVQLALTPRTNHWWNVAMRVTSRGLTTFAIPYDNRSFQITFDFVSHELVLDTSEGNRQTIPLAPQSVADFYFAFQRMLKRESIAVPIWPMPVEVPNPIRFDHDQVHASYAPEYVHRFWRILLTVSAVFEEFRSQFIGKCSPVHFFWGSFDLAVTRFSGRRAPDRPGADPITKEAYSHEVSSVGFWPGGGNVQNPAFYSYTAPEPPGFQDFAVSPAAARYDPELREFLLMYDDVRTSSSPRQRLLDFCQSTYEAGASLANWDRSALERRTPGSVKGAA
jgi:hypothetical protein